MGVCLRGQRCCVGATRRAIKRKRFASKHLGSKRVFWAVFFINGTGGSWVARQVGQGR